MAGPRFVAECVPPDGQYVLFRVPSERALRFAVTDRNGLVRLRTNMLGVALAAARKLVTEQGEAWLRASDDTTAYLAAGGVASGTPDCPWVLSVASALEA